MRIAFTGGRDYANRKMVEFVLDLIREVASTVAVDGDCQGEETYLVGDCPTGLDHIVQNTLGIGNMTIFHADWTKHGKAAGPIRNGQMLDSGCDLLIAFPGNRGTGDCVRQAKKRGITVLEVPQVTINSRQKGAAAERELAAKLRELGFAGARRGQQFSGSPDSPDVVAIQGLHIECKAVEKLNVWNAMEQAGSDCGEDEVPVVIFKKNGSDPNDRRKATWNIVLPLGCIHAFVAAVSAAADNDKEETC